MMGCRLVGLDIARVSDTNIHWSPPSSGYVKFNSDGAVCNHGSKAAVGGVFRDHEGRFLFGFALDLSPCSVIEAELHAILAGINLARLKGFRMVMIESDSLLVVRFIRDGCSSRHPLFNLVSNIRGLFAAGKWVLH